jgi:hypothetical protein
MNIFLKVIRAFHILNLLYTTTRSILYSQSIVQPPQYRLHLSNPSDDRLSDGCHLTDADYGFRTTHPNGWHPNPIRSDPV